MLEEINADRQKHAKKPFDDDDGNGTLETKTETKSTSDPESGLFHKGEHKNALHIPPIRHAIKTILFYTLRLPRKHT